MKKISILTPCYNGASFIPRLLNSVLEQTYENIEMFVINDGSTDNSEEIINSYIGKFNDRNIILTCVNQPNQGQASAINNGLKLITGDYLIWPDSDDFFASKNTLTKMATVLNEDPSIAVVRTFANLLEENTLKRIGEHGGDNYFQNKKNINLFEDCLYTINNFWYGAGDYMIRVNVLKETYNDMNIFVPSKYGGQNWQLMLPTLYKQKCYTIEEFLYNILARKKSHSRGLYKELADTLKKNEEYEKTIIETLKCINMPNGEFEAYCQNIKIKYQLNKIDILLLYNKIKEAKRVYSDLKNKYKHLPFRKQVIKIQFKLFPLVNKTKLLIQNVKMKK